MFCDILEYNSCLLAKTIQTRTCRQVYEYMRSDPSSTAQINHENRANCTSPVDRDGKQLNGGQSTSGPHSNNHHSDGHDQNIHNNNHQQAAFNSRPAAANRGSKSRKQKARKTHFLAYKLHDAAAAAAAEEEAAGGNISESEGTAKNRKRKHASRPRRCLLSF